MLRSGVTPPQSGRSDASVCTEDGVANDDMAVFEISSSTSRLKTKTSDWRRQKNEGNISCWKGFVRGAVEVMCGSRLNVLLVFIPVTIYGSGRWGDGVVFVFSLLSITPCAERLGFITEQLALHTNDTLGGLLNATFGNATEVIISIFALLKARHGVAGNSNYEAYIKLTQVSLLGSIFSNSLIVFGSSMIVGGLRFPVQYFNKYGADLSTVLLMLCSVSIAVLGSLHHTNLITEERELSFSFLASILSMVVYGIFLFFQLKTHRHLFEEDSDNNKADSASFGGFTPVRKNSDEEVVGAMVRRDSMGAYIEEGLGNKGMRMDSGAFSRPSTDDFDFQDGPGEEEEEEEEIVLGFGASIGWLSVVSVMISVLSESLVGAIQGASKKWSVPEEFIGAIVVPIAGNAAEHASALMFAYRNKMDITIGVALGSSVQVGLFVLPLCVIIGQSLGTTMSLTFGVLDIVALVLSNITVGIVVRGGQSNYLYGIVLVCIYILLAAGYWEIHS